MLLHTDEVFDDDLDDYLLLDVFRLLDDKFDWYLDYHRNHHDSGYATI